MDQDDLFAHIIHGCSYDHTSDSKVNPESYGWKTTVDKPQRKANKMPSRSVILGTDSTPAITQ